MPAQSPRHRRSLGLPILLALTALLIAGATARIGVAKAAAAADAPMTNDDLQRSRRLDTYTILADSGASRGENIYFYKCWMCHNQYAKTGPLLKDLYQRDTMSSGDPVNDDNVTAKIKEGGPGMPAFRTSFLIPISRTCAPISTPENAAWREKIRRRIPGTARKRRNGRFRPPLTAAPGIVRIATRRFRRRRRRPAGRAQRRAHHRVYRRGGKFEFPKMQAGIYTLRIPTPVPFKPYRKDSVSINGATKLDEIVLDSVAQSRQSAGFTGAGISAQQRGDTCGTCRERQKKKRRCRRIARDAIPGSRFSGIIMTSIAGA